MRHLRELFTWALFVAAGSVGLGVGIKLAERSLVWKGSIEKRLNALELRADPPAALQAVRRTRGKR